MSDQAGDHLGIQNIRARHETLNGRMKDWVTLSTSLFYSDFGKHQIAVMSVAVITNLIFLEDPPFQSKRKQISTTTSTNQTGTH